MAGDDDSEANDNPPPSLVVNTGDEEKNDEASADPKIIRGEENTDDDQDLDYVYTPWRRPRGNDRDDSSDDSDNEMGDIEMRKISHRRWVASDNVNKCSLEISYSQLMWNHSNLAYWLVNAPQPVLEIMEEVADKIIDEMHPDYRRTRGKIYLRISMLGVFEPIREIRHIHWNTMIRTGGTVTRHSRLFKQLLQVMRNCEKCGTTFGQFSQHSDSEKKVGPCPECQWVVSSINMEQTTYRNYQTLILQENFRDGPDGRNPRCKEILLFNELIDCAKPGDEIDVTGVYTYTSGLESINTKNGLDLPVFPPMIEANYVKVTKKKDPFVQLN